MESLAIYTDVFSYVFKGDTRAKPYAALLAGRTNCLSFITVAELFGPSCTTGVRLVALRQSIDRVRKHLRSIIDTGQPAALPGTAN